VIGHTRSPKFRLSHLEGDFSRSRGADEASRSRTSPAVASVRWRRASKARPRRAENGTRKPASASEQERRCGVVAVVVRTVTGTCAKVTPRWCCVGSSEPEAVETGGES
jgi:hypothetical protein